MAWKKLDGLDFHYEVNKSGIVRRIDGLGNATILLQKRNIGGYLVVSVKTSGMWRNRSVHRLVAQAFLGVPPPGHHVNHKNSKRNDPRLCNLEYVTPKQNSDHAHRRLDKRTKHCLSLSSASKMLRITPGSVKNLVAHGYLTYRKRQFEKSESWSFDVREIMRLLPYMPKNRGLGPSYYAQLHRNRAPRAWRGSIKDLYWGDTPSGKPITSRNVFSLHPHLAKVLNIQKQTPVTPISKSSPV